MVQSNRLGAQCLREFGATACTDVTGFGLLGHTLEMCRGSKLRASIQFDAAPLLHRVAGLVQTYRTGAAVRNWASYGEDVALAPGLGDWRRDVLCDPQTSGGLLIAAAPEATAQILAEFRNAGFDRAAIIGEMRDGPPGIAVV